MGVLHEVARRGDLAYLNRELVKDRQLDNIDCLDEDGWTPLHFACMKGNEAVAMCLISKGAAPNAQTKCGRTPLQMASIKNLSNVVRRLIQEGANPQLRDKQGNRAFDVCPKGKTHADTLVLLYEFEEGGPPDGMELAAAEAAATTTAEE